MKHIKKLCVVVAIAMTTLFVSCNEQEYEIECEVYEIEYEGHTYLYFDGCGIVHDPNCELCKTIK